MAGADSTLRALRRASAGVLFALLCGLATAAPAPLHILVEDASDPFSRADGSGYANEVVVAAFKAAGVDVVLDVVPYARCKAYVLRGLSVACFGMSWDPAFQGKIRFASAPLYSVTPIYFQNAGHRVAARSEAELGKGSNIGVVNGYEYPESALRAQARGAVFHAARSERINLKKLALNRLDLALVMTNDLQGTAFLPNDAGVAGQVVPAFASGKLDTFIGFSTQHAQGKWARDKFNHGYASLVKNGKFKEIWMRWATKK